MTSIVYYKLMFTENLGIHCALDIHSVCEVFLPSPFIMFLIKVIVLEYVAITNLMLKYVMQQLPIYVLEHASVINSWC
jgi:hypothetical protein